MSQRCTAHASIPQASVAPADGSLQLRDVMDHLQEGILLVDDSLRIKEVNTRAPQLLGRPTDEILDQPLLDVLGLSHLAEEFHAADIASADAVRYPVSIGATMLEATVTRAGHERVVFLRDVTEERRTQSMRREMLNLLAHELRAPLHVLMGMQRLLEKPKENLREQAVTALRSNVEQMKESVTKILSVADARADLCAISAEVDVPHLLRTVFQGMKERPEAKSLDVTLSLPATAPKVLGEPDLLTRAIKEILSNAIDYCPPNGAIHVEFLTHSDSIEVAVEDSGPGIAETERERVFEEFYQSSPFLNRPREGLGLGLALVRRAALLHGGSARAEKPTRLKGARIVLRLPVLSVAEGNELERLRRELELAQKQNMAFATDLARSYAGERQQRTALSKSQEQLARSAKLATLGQMVAGLAHDMNNMIAPIGGYAELVLMNTDLPEKCRRHVERIRQAEDRATTMLRNMLHFGANRSAQQTVVPLQPVLQNAVEFLEYGMTRKGVRIVLEIDPTLPNVLADSGQLEQVLVNLMVNAQHAMEPAGGELRIAARKGEGTVSILVADQGSGIPKEAIDRIFEPFFTTKQCGKGSGLGLFICHEIIERHGGTIDVASTPGVGTTFQIQLPIAKPVPAGASGSGALAGLMC